MFINYETKMHFNNALAMMILVANLDALKCLQLDTKYYDAFK